MSDILYTAFNHFLDVETWHTQHETDLRRFYDALKRVVENDDFSPEAMGEYMRTRLKLNRDDDTPLTEAVDEYVSRAWTIKEYLEW